MLGCATESTLAIGAIKEESISKRAARAQKFITGGNLASDLCLGLNPMSEWNAHHYID